MARKKLGYSHCQSQARENVGSPQQAGDSVVVPFGQAIWLEGIVVIIEVLSQGGVETGDSKQDLENDRGSSTGNMRSLVLRNKMYQEGNGEATGGKRCLLRTRAPFGEGHGDVLQSRAPERSPDANAESPHSGPSLHLHLKWSPEDKQQLAGLPMYTAKTQALRHPACLPLPSNSLFLDYQSCHSSSVAICSELGT